MAGQTPVEPKNGSPEGPAKVFARSVSQYIRDIITLSELQSRLLVIDLKQAARRATGVAVLLVVACGLLAGSFPVLLMAIAYAFVEGKGWPLWAGFLTATVIGVVLSACFGAGGAMLLRGRLAGFERSRRELARNLRWLKESLSADGRMRHRDQD